MSCVFIMNLEKQREREGGGEEREREKREREGEREERERREREERGERERERKKETFNINKGICTFTTCINSLNTCDALLIFCFYITITFITSFNQVHV